MSAGQAAVIEALSARLIPAIRNRSRVSEEKRADFAATAKLWRGFRITLASINPLGSARMKWTAYNAFGGTAWLSGLLLAKNQTFVGNGTIWSADHHVLTGLTLAAMGLVVLVWTNLRTSG